jgi:GAF domain-containing protein
MVLRENMFDTVKAAIDDRECAGELGAVVEQLISGAAAALEADATLLVLLDEAEAPALAASCFTAALPDSALNALVVITGEVIRDGRTLVCPQDPIPGPPGGGSLLSVPLPVADRPFGALSVYRLQERGWDAEDARATHAHARLLRLLLKHAAGVHRPAANGRDWCALLLPQQVLLRSPTPAAAMWTPNAG